MKNSIQKIELTQAGFSLLAILVVAGSLSLITLTTMSFINSERQQAQKVISSYHLQKTISNLQMLLMNSDLCTAAFTKNNWNYGGASSPNIDHLSIGNFPIIQVGMNSGGVQVTSLQLGNPSSATKNSIILGTSFYDQYDTTLDITTKALFPKNSSPVTNSLPISIISDPNNSNKIFGCFSNDEVKKISAQFCSQMGKTIDPTTQKCSAPVARSSQCDISDMSGVSGSCLQGSDYFPVSGGIQCGETGAKGSEISSTWGMHMNPHSTQTRFCRTGDNYNNTNGISKFNFCCKRQGS